ncbi:lytic transglycosylase domain-containing protein [Paenalcaligenes suwonensis]|uniref:lytic transglycosylase domain-containing protein n=1 Tax=Paenalcaligenes suwonensis TaxID=1202713 RepID=UPI0014084C03|nr:lytic transglycosylase domain-containing protein [Paenalcaligenes suwonensis]NHC60663.1 lytic transglycosylase domain-containing protein [Paenalcaligenes suwonensis]
MNPDWAHQGLRLVRYRISEFVHMCAIYLGIAVLVTVAAGLVVPSIREQARQLYSVMVDALRPEVLNNDNFAQFAWMIPDATSGAVAVEEGEEPPPPIEEEEIEYSAYQGFVDTLQRTVAGTNVGGISKTQFQALRSYIARKYKIAHSVSGALVQTAFTVGAEKRIDPQLILAVIAIESSYNPFAESHAGAQGLMQVMTRVHRDKLENYVERELAVFSPEANIRAGTQILYDCRKRRGSLTGALACYVGATGPSDGGYGARVLAERRRMALASGIPIRD